MISYSSTLVICMQCHTCGKYLKETEYYFWGNRCTECHVIEITGIRPDGRRVS